MDPADSVFAGLAIQIGGNTHFGWADLAVSLDSFGNATTIQVNGFAFQAHPGVSIKAGAVPEPTAFGLLAVGASAVVARRKRRPVSSE